MKPTFTIKNAEHGEVWHDFKLFKAFGIRVSIHKFVGADTIGVYHTHPGRALRCVLLGGYVEELWRGRKVTWRPLSFGWVEPTLCHRVDKLLNGKWSYTLWLRWPRTHTVEMRYE
jgi:hypothetical protein